MRRRTTRKRSELVWSPLRFLIIATALLGVLATACDGEAADDTTTGPPTTSTTTTAGPPDTVPTTTTTTTVAFPPLVDGVWAGPPEVRDVALYTAWLGITVEEANRRNDLVEAFFEADLATWLERRNTMHWVEESAESWTLIAARTRVPDALIERLGNQVAGTPLEGLVETRTVEHDLDRLRRTAQRIGEIILDWCLPRPTTLYVDYQRNRVVIGVHSLDEFERAAVAAGVSLRTDRRFADEFLIEERPVDDPPGVDTTRCDAPLQELAEARRRWESHGLDRYAYDATVSSTWVGSVEFGGVMVWDGEVTELLSPELTPDNLFYPPRFVTWFGTIERMFDIIESNPAQWVKVRYDTQWGFPTSFYFDRPTSIDEERGWSLAGFRVLDTPPDPAPPRENQYRDDALAIESVFSEHVVIVDAEVGPAGGLDQSNEGWRHTVEVTEVIYAYPAARRIEAGPLDITDPIGSYAPRALLHRAGEKERLMLTVGHDGRWLVYAVLKFTPDGLVLDGPRANRGYSEELGYLCHFPRSDIPTDPPPLRDAEAEFELLLRWLDEGTSPEALRSLCDERNEST